jgi:primosomal protein N' (replication factor Y)
LRCKEVRRCTACGTAADLGDICRRCGAALGACKRCDGERFEPLGAGVGRIVDELKRSVDGVSAAGDVEAPVVVGTERDLPAAGRVDVSVAIDADGAIFGPNYRAGEDAFRLLARLAAIVDPGSGNRCIVQTASPQHPVITALRGGHPMEYLTEELAARTEAGVPPAAELMAIEVGNAPPDIDAELRDVISSGVLGPAEAGDKQRWLVEGSNLREAKVRLRWLVQKWRDAGAHVRVDVDPLDL